MNIGSTTEVLIKRFPKGAVRSAPRESGVRLPHSMPARFMARGQGRRHRQFPVIRLRLEFRL
jgi:hypothetical protein